MGEGGGILSDVRNQIGDLDIVDTLELGNFYQTPEGSRGWLFWKNYVSEEAGQCLTDSESIKSSRASNIVRTYRFKGK